MSLPQLFIQIRVKVKRPLRLRVFIFRALRSMGYTLPIEFLVRLEVVR